MVIAVKVLSDFDKAVEHIEEYGSGHTEVITRQDYSKTQAFICRINSAVVMANVSSRFSDGGQLG
jgi:glutamate-5-semialdehyde dehydrogenase